ncbi:hypothetical protein K9L67_05620 [Candidatus Woesearchaeota archaeon]|nr:hypothetical protein [Candidatus Woesearchaeota archaeon]MCF7901673.1 hypothetical protein [Candidatus Woesearchaeota archaeon]MCF8013738.1 hypothetical protein [Candidatus Woesearchaeota archaeon]
MNEEEKIGCCGGHCHSEEKESSCGDDCCCEDTVEEKVEYANDKIDAMIRLLIKKGLISEDEIESEYSAVFDEDHEEDDSEGDSEEEEGDSEPKTEVQ